MIKLVDYGVEDADEVTPASSAAQPTVSETGAASTKNDFRESFCREMYGIGYKDYRTMEARASGQIKPREYLEEVQSAIRAREEMEELKKSLMNKQKQAFVKSDEQIGEVSSSSSAPAQPPSSLASGGSGPPADADALPEHPAATPMDHDNVGFNPAAGDAAAATVDHAVTEDQKLNAAAAHAAKFKPVFPVMVDTSSASTSDAHSDQARKEFYRLSKMLASAERTLGHEKVSDWSRLRIAMETRHADFKAGELSGTYLSKCISTAQHQLEALLSERMGDGTKLDWDR